MVVVVLGHATLRDGPVVPRVLGGVALGTSHSILLGERTRLLFQRVCSNDHSSTHQDTDISSENEKRDLGGRGDSAICAARAGRSDSLNSSGLSLTPAKDTMFQEIPHAIRIFSVAFSHYKPHLFTVSHNTLQQHRMKTVLVAGATGATGKFVVQQLLDKGHKVRVVARSKERMMNLLNDNAGGDRLSVTEASLLDLPESKLQELTNGCDGT